MTIDTLFTEISAPEDILSQISPKIALATAGFNFSVDLNTVSAGEYSLRFLMGSGNEAFWCDAKKSVVVQ